MHLLPLSLTARSSDAGSGGSSGVEVAVGVVVVAVVLAVEVVLAAVVLAVEVVLAVVVAVR